MKKQTDEWKNLLHHQKHELRFGEAVIAVEVEVFTPDPELTYSASIIIDNLPPLAGLRVADVGTGTGVIAVTLAFRGANEVIATDISDIAIQNARANIDTNNVSNKVEVLKTSLLDGVEGKFDLICANLPILDEVWERPETNSLATVELLLQQAKIKLNSHGEIYLSWASFAGKKEVLEKLFEKHGYHFHLISAERLGHVWYLYILFFAPEEIKIVENSSKK